MIDACGATAYLLRGLRALNHLASESNCDGGIDTECISPNASGLTMPCYNNLSCDDIACGRVLVSWPETEHLKQNIGLWP